ncbi:cytochrome P450 [Actinocatenispora rupis]|uniref:Cytochrome P450 n=1 Tax=Actinocatenispora rupis TaxID=519421 RepID=A0A8J3JD62_9ACTN|nr:cytochrome P450 [Actinocatenispora rupis]
MVSAQLPGDQRTWLLTRHEDVRAALADPALSSNRRNPGFPLRAFGVRPPADFPQPMIGLDGAAHSAARRPVISEFSVPRVHALRPRIQQIVDEAIDTLLAAGQPADLVRYLSLPVPSLVICELLGVPYADHEFFQSRSARLVNRAVDPDERMAAATEVREYLDGLVTEKEREPGDDLLGRQILRARADGTEDHGGLVSLAFLLLIAGHETTANMISLGTLALLTHPDQLGLVRDDPATTPLAVEELLRYFSIVDSGTARVAVADTEIGGQPIAAGEGVIALGLAANRDPQVFERPDDLDVTRGARHHVAFGFGPHQCLGQNLARAELTIVFDTLLRRVPTLALAGGVEDIPTKQDATIYGCYELPVTW